MVIVIRLETLKQQQQNETLKQTNKKIIYKVQPSTGKKGIF